MRHYLKIFWAFVCFRVFHYFVSYYLSVNNFMLSCDATKMLEYLLKSLKYREMFAKFIFKNLSIAVLDFGFVFKQIQVIFEGFLWKLV